jgi:hypothetical protein
MSQIFDMDDDLRPEYDFTQMTVVARGEGRKHKPLIVQLEPDVAAMFPDAGAVNEGLRLLMRLIQQNQSSPIESLLTPSNQ